MPANLVGLHAERRFQQRGSALLIVLASLALILVIVLPFLLLSQTQLSAAKSSAQEDAVKQLADRCVNTVIAQLRDATTGGSTVAWASQPGMIRTYDNTGAPLMAYKLFSSDSMRATGAYNSTQDPLDAPSAVNWSTEPGLYIDLNAPISINGTNPYTAYPIIDPAAVAKQTYTNAAALSPSLASGNPATSIEGCYIPTGTTVPGASTANPLPMPVQWLYVLQDGTMVVPTLPAGFTSGDAATVAGATATNPVVGRVAFWTDDETSKVNINTSSEGTFWDLPRSEGTTERNYAQYQLVKNEFQRYPGHPAMTSLSGIFPGLAASAGYPETLYPLIPRLSAGGSQEGTKDSSAIPSTTTPIVLNTNRLYASIDEFLFNPSAVPRVKNNALITNTTLELAKFFITTSSRAPEVNLFNKPRVTIWPISSYLSTDPADPTNTASHTTATDRLIAFCSTMRNDLATPYRYFFQRKDPDSQATDIGLPRNTQLYQYLHNLTALPVPGFGGTSTTGILSKYGTDQDQVLTEIFDYVRATNLQDYNLPPTTLSAISGTPPYQSITFASNEYSPLRLLPNKNPNSLNHLITWFPNLLPGYGPYGLGQGIACPTHYTPASGVETRGFGRFPTISKAGIWFFQNLTPAPTGQTALPAYTNPPPAGKVQVEAALIFDLFDPSLGWSGLNGGGYTLDISTTGSPTWGGVGGSTSNPLNCTGVWDVVGDSAFFSGGATFGGRMGFYVFMIYRGEGTVANGTNTTCYSNLNVPNTTTQLTYSDIPLTLKMEYNGSVVQTINVTIPGSTVPMPTYPAVATSFLAAHPYTPASTGPPAVAASGYNNYNYNIAQRMAGSDGLVFQPEDVVRTVQCASGDVRLIAGAQTIAATAYAKHQDYDTSTKQFAHSLFPPSPYSFQGATLTGQLVSGANYNTTSPHMSVPDVPSTTGVYVGGAGSPPGSTGAIPGDWDNSMAAVPDGPYINKADEGTTYGLDTGQLPYFSKPAQGFYLPTSTLYSSPNRQIPSAGMFGSLSTGVQRNLPWQTLLFRPGPAGHPGQGLPAPTTTGIPVGALPYTTLPDYLLLDLFTMPVVQPYAISEPFSSAGKVNMNYQIMPFTYITRETAIRAAMKKEMIMAIPTGDGNKYKLYTNATNPPSYRFAINMSETLKGFQQRFANNDIFRSASEICALDLVPTTTGASSGNMWAGTGFWSSNGLTGDNTLERPYTDIYQRLTTKSNTYTVHFRVQLLVKPKQRMSSAPTSFDVSQGDTIAAEYRGSSIIERYVDPNDKSLPDFVDPTNATAVVDSYYRYHILSTKQFNP